MHPLLCLLGALLMLGGSVLPVAAEGERVMTAKEQFASLSWLEGRWRGDGLEASYTSTEGWLMLSVTKHYATDGNSVFGEFEQFAIRGGVVTLTPYPGGQKSEHSFPLVFCDPVRKRVEFENPEHDWPTHFMYESPAPDTLHIVVSGPDEFGEESSLEFFLSREADPSAQSEVE